MHWASVLCTLVLMCVACNSTHLASDGLLLDQLIDDVIDGFPVVADVLQGHLV